MFTGIHLILHSKITRYNLDSWYRKWTSNIKSRNVSETSTIQDDLVTFHSVLLIDKGLLGAAAVALHWYFKPVTMTGPHNGIFPPHGTEFMPIQISESLYSVLPWYEHHSDALESLKRTCFHLTAALKMHFNLHSPSDWANKNRGRWTPEKSQEHTQITVSHHQV